MEYNLKKNVMITNDLLKYQKKMNEVEKDTLALEIKIDGAN